ncbi:MAG: hypothetical protein SangKO_019170 [Sandaracinaceae bacterium]
MERPKVRRQHETTTVTEVHGLRCDEFVAIWTPDVGYTVLSIRLEGTWHTFGVDEGMLDWEEAYSPEDMGGSEALEPGERWVDLAEELRVRGVEISDASMDDCTFVMTFANGAKLTLSARAGQPVVTTRLHPGPLTS